MKHLRFTGALLPLVAASFLYAAEPPAQPPAPAPEPPDQETLEARFAELLTGSVLLGSFTNVEEGKEPPLNFDKYTIDAVTKGEGDRWLFDSRVQYGGKDVKVKMPFDVKWAGDTPVITLTKLPVPGLGVFTARILFYDRQYAGTWSAGDHGGHMFGRVVKQTELPREAPATTPPAASNE